MSTADENNLFSSKARGIFRKGLIFFPIKSIIEEKIYAGCAIDDMAQKNKKTEEFISLTAEALKVVSYADYFTQTPLFTSLQIKNAGSDAVTDLTLAVSNENGLLTACVKRSRRFRLRAPSKWTSEISFLRSISWASKR